MGCFVLGHQGAIAAVPDGDYVTVGVRGQSTEQSPVLHPVIQGDVAPADDENHVVAF